MRPYTGPVNEILTWAEIQERFPNEWVVIDEPEVNEDLEVVRGRVVYHGADRAAASRSVIELGLHHTAVLYLGEPIPPGVAAVL